MVTGGSQSFERRPFKKFRFRGSEAFLVSQILERGAMVAGSFQT